MNTHAALQQQAITAAKQQNWEAAATYNEEILTQDPEDVGALNRLGVAQMQLGQVKSARTTFKRVLGVDKSNAIAKKHLSKLENNQILVTPSFTNEYFIEEPGKTKTVELHRLAGKNVLEKLSVGQACELKLKNRFVSVEHKGTHIGALPEDLSFRLSNLMKTGNTYACFIQSFTGNSCSVYLKELHRSPDNLYTNSFPVNKTNLAALNDAINLDEMMLEEIPVSISDGEEMVDVDVEKPFEDLTPEE